MAAVPTGPSSALPASPSEVTPFPGGGSVDPGEEEEESGRGRGGLVTSGSGDKRSIKKNKINMLSRVNPAALHLQTQPQEQQQVNGLVSPGEDGVQHRHQHTDDRPDDPRPSADHRDSGGEETTSDKNNSDHRHHEDRGLCLKSSNHPHLNNNSMNGLLTFTRTETVQSHPGSGAFPGNDRRAECDPSEPPRPPVSEPPDREGLEAPRPGVGGEPDSALEPPVAALEPPLSELEPPVSEPGPPVSELEPPVSELGRLHLNCSPGRVEEESDGIHYVRYESELQMPGIMRLITKDLSEPYSIYTYRYFIHNWPQLCFLAMVEHECVGAIVCKLDMHKKMFRRGYIAMLAVDSKHRRKSIGTNLVKKAIFAMVEGDCDEVVLETEITNKSALKLYENLGFVRDKRLFRYYLNGVDALRLKLWLR